MRYDKKKLTLVVHIVQTATTRFKIDIILNSNFTSFNLQYSPSVV